MSGWGRRGYILGVAKGDRRMWVCVFVRVVEKQRGKELENIWIGLSFGLLVPSFFLLCLFFLVRHILHLRSFTVQ